MGPDRAAPHDQRRRSAPARAAVAYGLRLYTGRDSLERLALYFLIAAPPGSLIFRGDRGWPRWVLAAMTASIVAIAVVVRLAAPARR